MDEDSDEGPVHAVADDGLAVHAQRDAVGEQAELLSADDVGDLDLGDEEQACCREVEEHQG